MYHPLSSHLPLLRHIYHQHLNIESNQSNVIKRDIADAYAADPKASVKVTVWDDDRFIKDTLIGMYILLLFSSLLFYLFIFFSFLFFSYLFLISFIYFRFPSRLSFFRSDRGSHQFSQRWQVEGTGIS